MGRRTDVGALLLHSAIVAGVVGGALLLVRQAAPAFVLLALAAGLTVAGLRMPEPGRTVEGEPRDALPDPPRTPHRGTDGPPVETADAGTDTLDQPDAPETGEPIDVPRLVPGPAGRPADPWAPPTRRIRIAATGHEAAVDRARREGPAITVTLVSDIASPHHPYAVAVFADDAHLGSLAGDDLLDYGPALAALAVRGMDIRTTAQWHPDGLDLLLPPPSGLVPVNDVPHGVRLPHGAPLPVLTDSDSGVAEDGPGDAVLRRLAKPGEDVWVAAVLRAVRPSRRGLSVSVVEVLIDGTVVGRLASEGTDDILPLLTYLDDRGVTAVAAARLHGSSLHRRLEVRCLRAQDAEEDWLRSVGR